MWTLEHVKVLEYAEMVAGPYCAKLLAGLGAEVIKIEQRGVGDPARRRGPFYGDTTDPEGSVLFLYLNTDKKSVTLDVTSDGGREVLHRLLQWADILLEDKPPQQAKALGIDYESVRKTNPDIVHVSITPFGQTGPYSDFKAYPFNVWQAGGAGYLCPAGMVTALLPDRPPTKGGNYVGEYDAGIEGATGALLALMWRVRTGRGQHVDISKQEVLMKVMEHELQWYPNEGVAMSKGGTWPYAKPSRKHMNPVATYSPLRCKDGYISILAFAQYQWEYLVKALGNPPWAQEFATEEQRQQHGGRLRDLLEAWTTQHTREEAVRIVQAAGCPAGPFYDTKEVTESPHLEARRFWLELHHPRTGSVRYPGPPCTFKVNSWRSRTAAPLLGQHTEQVMRDILGYSEGAVARLRQSGIL